MIVKQFVPTNQETGGKDILPVGCACLPIRTTKDLFLGLLGPERAVVGSGAHQPKFPQNESVVRAERASGLMTSLVPMPQHGWVSFSAARFGALR